MSPAPALLEKFDAALCIADSNKFKRVDATTAGYTYLRYHGRGETIYWAKYSDDELKKEAKLIRKSSQTTIADIRLF